VDSYKKKIVIDSRLYKINFTGDTEDSYDLGMQKIRAGETPDSFEGPDLSISFFIKQKVKDLGIYETYQFQEPTILETSDIEEVNNIDEEDNGGDNNGGDNNGGDNNGGDNLPDFTTSGTFSLQDPTCLEVLYGSGESLSPTESISFGISVNNASEFEPVTVTFTITGPEGFQASLPKCPFYTSVQEAFINGDPDDTPPPPNPSQYNVNGYILTLGTSSDPNFVAGPYTETVAVGETKVVSFEITAPGNYVGLVEAIPYFLPYGGVTITVSN
jgi:hypothetical protein